jgi:hypothetical protein
VQFTAPFLKLDAGGKMKIAALRLNSVQNQNNQYYTKKSLMNSNKDFVSNTDLTNLNGIHGRYLTFKGMAPTLTEKVRVLAQFLQGEVAPFLQRHKPLHEQNASICSTARNIDAVLRQKEMTLFEQLQKGIKPEELDFVAKNIGKPLARLANIEEYKYLARKSIKYYTPELVAYADSIKPEVQAATPYLKSLFPAIFRVQRTGRDVRNGFANLQLEQSAPELFAKKKAVYEAKITASFNNSSYGSVDLFNDQAIGVIAKAQANLRQHEQAITDYFGSIDRIKSAMANHEGHLPHIQQRTTQAQEQLDANAFTTEEVEQAFLPLEAKKAKIVNKSIRRLREYFDEHPEYVWKSEHDAETDALLAKQVELNTALWKKIEVAKTAYNSGEVLSPTMADKALDALYEDVPF